MIPPAPKRQNVHPSSSSSKSNGRGKGWHKETPLPAYYTTAEIESVNESKVGGQDHDDTQTAQGVSPNNSTDRVVKSSDVRVYAAISSEFNRLMENKRGTKGRALARANESRSEASAPIPTSSSSPAQSMNSLLILHSTPSDPAGSTANDPLLPLPLQPSSEEVATERLLGQSTKGAEDNDKNRTTHSLATKQASKPQSKETAETKKNIAYMLREGHMRLKIESMRQVSTNINLVS